MDNTNDTRILDIRKYRSNVFPLALLNAQRTNSFK